jgi:hypothetical protein
MAFFSKILADRFRFSFIWISQQSFFTEQDRQSCDQPLKPGGPGETYLPTYSSCSHLEHRTSVKRFVSLQFLNSWQSVGLLGRELSPSRSLYLHRTAQTQNKRTQTSMPWVRFEPMIPAFEWGKTNALDRTATVIGYATAMWIKSNGRLLWIGCVLRFNKWGWISQLNIKASVPASYPYSSRNVTSCL